MEDWQKRQVIQESYGDDLFAMAYIFDEEKNVDFGWTEHEQDHVKIQLRHLTDNQIGDLIHLLEELKAK